MKRSESIQVPVSIFWYLLFTVQDNGYFNRCQDKGMKWATRDVALILVIVKSLLSLWFPLVNLWKVMNSKVKWSTPSATATPPGTTLRFLHCLYIPLVFCIPLVFTGATTLISDSCNYFNYNLFTFALCFYGLYGFFAIFKATRHKG